MNVPSNYFDLQYQNAEADRDRAMSIAAAAEERMEEAALNYAQSKAQELGQTLIVFMLDNKKTYAVCYSKPDPRIAYVRDDRDGYIYAEWITGGYVYINLWDTDPRRLVKEYEKRVKEYKNVNPTVS